MKKHITQGLVSGMMLLACLPTLAQLNVRQLRVEHMQNPTTLDNPNPRLSWINEAKVNEKGQKQTAYRICVSSSLQNLENGVYDVWDSGKQKSEDSYLIPYAGNNLESGKDYWWKVQTWDRKGKASAWSEPAHWGMGLMNENEWRAQWIQAEENVQSPLFRKAFNVKKSIKQAKMFVTGLGYFELYVNGQRIGDDYLVPNFTNYTHRPELTSKGIALDDKNFRDFRVLYLAYDVTSQLKQGENAMGVILGNGFYRCGSHWVCSFGTPCMIGQLKLTYEDGTEEWIASDTSWKTHASPIQQNGPYDGEFYDARNEIKNWASVGCDESAWKAALAAKKPDGKLTAHASPTDKITTVLKPRAFEKTSEDTYVVDFGKEISGWIRLNGVKGSAGDTLDIKYVCESPLGIHKYVFANNEAVDYAPRFTWYVFSKAIITGVKNLNQNQITAEAVNTDVAVDAEFSSSNHLLNTLNTIWQRSQMDNMHGCVASDCPHRERSPYTGDGQIASAMVMANFDAAAFYQKWIRDMRDSQDAKTGYVPNGAPWQPGCGGGVPWGAAMNVMPWEYYLNYGDLQMLEENYEPMQMQANQMLQWQTPEGTMLQQKCNEGSTSPNAWFNLGDWVPPYGSPSNEIVHTFYMWLCFHNTALAAEALGKQSDMEKFEEQAQKVKDAFHKKFYNVEAKSYGDFGCNVYALAMGVPDDRKEDVINSLRKEIMETHEGHINTGFVATRFIFTVLAENGLVDVAQTILNKKDFPSYGWWIEQGATVTWEQWDGSSSHNHPMFGGGLVYLYRNLAGLQVDEKKPGYKHFYVKPTYAKDLDFVTYTKETPYGKVKSAIRHTATTDEIEVTVPVGTSATTLIPVSNPAKITSALKENKLKGIYLKKEGLMQVEMKQGHYRLVIEK